MQEVKEGEVNMFDLLPPDEGEMNLYYGRVRQGKTYAATCDVFDDLKRGQVVYTNWKVNWQGWDDRNSKLFLFLGLLGLRRFYYKFPIENWHWLPIDENFVDKISTLTDCKIYLDEAHVAVDSYEATRMDIKKRTAFLATGHFNRTINVITQRPTGIHAVVRENVNRFYKIEKTFQWGRWVRFERTEFQDMIGGTVNENSEPISVKHYWGKKEIFEMYDTQYLRGDLPSSQSNEAVQYRLTMKEKYERLMNKIKSNDEI